MWNTNYRKFSLIFKYVHEFKNCSLFQKIFGTCPKKSHLKNGEEFNFFMIIKNIHDFINNIHKFKKCHEFVITMFTISKNVRQSKNIHDLKKST